ARRSRQFQRRRTRRERNVTSPHSIAENPKVEEQPTQEQAMSKLPGDGGARPTEPTSAPTSNKRVGWFVAVGAIGFAVALVVIYIITTLPRVAQRQRLAAAARSAVDSPPRVNVVKARREAGSTERLLPGNAQAYRETGLYARTTGYL